MVEKPTITSNELNEEVITWSTRRKIRAEVLPMKADEALAFNKDIYRQTYKFNMHYYSDILRTDRLDYNGQKWNIREIHEIGLRRGITIIAEAIE